MPVCSPEQTAFSHCPELGVGWGGAPGGRSTELWSEELSLTITPGGGRAVQREFVDSFEDLLKVLDPPHGKIYICIYNTQFLTKSRGHSQTSESLWSTSYGSMDSGRHCLLEFLLLRIE